MMSLPGLLIRIAAFVFVFVAWAWNRSFLDAIGIQPTYVARLAWNFAFMMLIALVALPAAKRVDGKVSERWKL